MVGPNLVITSATRPCEDAENWAWMQEFLKGKARGRVEEKGSGKKWMHLGKERKGKEKKRTKRIKILQTTSPKKTSRQVLYACIGKGVIK